MCGKGAGACTVGKGKGLTLLRLRETHNALQLPVSFFICNIYLNLSKIQ